METPWLWLIPLLPFLGTLLNALLHAGVLRRRQQERDLMAPAVAVPERLAGWIGTGAVALSFLVAVAAFLRLKALPVDERVLTATLAPWIQAGSLDLSWTLSIDPLNAAMMLVVTGVGALIHLYSIGYMHGDKGFCKYFSYLNLFVGMMLMLILSESLLGLFLGWEGVGLCSYLLIGFWYEDGEKADAARKAFIVNRIGDFGFLIGMFLLYWGGGGSLNMSDINAAASQGAFSEGLATLAGLCLFLGCCGKSAQIPLYVWLPDAMAGPTPVSALIHAATMVTSGIYLVARLGDFFAFAPGVLPVIACVGAATALFAATIGIAQRDIKKVLAYSTVSQLGYMFLGLGVGAFTGAVFHLITHAFFKALLFLGAGSVIHAMHHQQDMFKMGGLRDRIPITYKTMLIGAFALAGVPLFSGFFSKDLILFETATGHTSPWLLWLVGAGGAALTATYTGRLLALTFYGEARFDPQKTKVHESPRTMTLPLMVLAVLSIAGGLLGIPFIMHPLADWLDPVVGQATLEVRGEHHPAHGLEIALLLVGSAIAIGFLSFGLRHYRRSPEEQRSRADQATGLLRWLANAWFVDALYALLVTTPLKILAILSATVDVFFVDGTVNWVARRSRATGNDVRRMQSGGANDYALWFSLGAVVIVVGLLAGTR
ncbi:MAG: NADH-quinone oxidoreductase subunit L [Planctomycetota bacterium]|nr:MAG: NADH-quinone oxidoreductase subunit L [Planctomycetota bacterium]